MRHLYNVGSRSKFLIFSAGGQQLWCTHTCIKKCCHILLLYQSIWIAQFLLNPLSNFSFSSWRIRAYLITIPPCFLAWYTVAYSWNSFHLFCFANCVSIAHNCSTYTQYGFVRKVFFFQYSGIVWSFRKFSKQKQISSLFFSQLIKIQVLFLIKEFLIKQYWHTGQDCV